MLTDLTNYSFDYNLTLLNRPVSSSYIKITTNIMENINNTAFSFDFSNFYFSCEQTLGLFSNPSLNRYLVTHDLADCEDVFTTAIQTTNYPTTKSLSVYSLSASITQLYDALNGIVTECSCPKYGIVYANEVFYKEMTQNIVSKLFENANKNNVTNNLNFSISINAPNLANLILNSDIQSKF